MNWLQNIFQVFMPFYIPTSNVQEFQAILFLVYFLYNCLGLQRISKEPEEAVKVRSNQMSLPYCTKVPRKSGQVTWDDSQSLQNDPYCYVSLLMFSHFS